MYHICQVLLDIYWAVVYGIESLRKCYVLGLGQSPKGTAGNWGVIEEKGGKMRREMIGIMNQTFSKISQKYSLTTSQYDSLVDFEKTLIESFFLNQDDVYRDIFSKFYKLFLKRVMRSGDDDFIGGSRGEVCPECWAGQQLGRLRKSGG